MRDLADAMGTREAAICRELTKLHEEVSRASLAELAEKADRLETRGEFVLVIGPPAADAQVLSADALDDLLRDQLGHHSVKDAVAHAVELSGRPRREVYARALELAKQSEGRPWRGLTARRRKRRPHRSASPLSRPGFPRKAAPPPI